MNSDRVRPVREPKSFHKLVGLDNITDWALDEFRNHYKTKAIEKDDVFAYVYAILNDPNYREAYAENLRRGFPRVPFRSNFKQWCKFGNTLLDLHLGYASAKPYALKRADVTDAKARNAGQKPRVILRADHDTGIIVLDSETQLSGIPSKAWDYKLGNRSAIEWVLDTHRERQAKDDALRQLKLRPYSFGDHKEEVVELLRRGTTVSLKTIETIEAMAAAAKPASGVPNPVSAPDL